MTFAYPLWLVALLLAPAMLVLFVLNERRRQKALGQLVAARLKVRLTGAVSTERRWAVFLLQLFAVVCAVLAAARPQWGFDNDEIKRSGRDVLLAVDVSRSMLATDTAPNRLTRARMAAQDLIRQLDGDRVGLIAFAGTSFLSAPLTPDYNAVTMSLAELDTEFIPQGGSNIEDMIRTAQEAFGKGEGEHRALIIFSDGEELDTDGLKAADEFRKSCRIFTVGIGSPDGALIPLPPQQGGGFVRDNQGQIVKTRLDESRLRKIAERGGGFYVRLQSGRAEMERLVSEGITTMKASDYEQQSARRPIERYQWPLGLGCLALIASLLIRERRNGPAIPARVAAAVALAFFTSGPARAVNAGVEAYQKKDYAKAADEFSRQSEKTPGAPVLKYNSGAAEYQAGNYDNAIHSFSESLASGDARLREKSAYNLGNALFKRGNAAPPDDPDARRSDWQDALKHYDHALTLNPANDDAKFNREFVKKALEEFEKQQEQDGEGQGGKGKKKKKKKDGQKGDQSGDGEPGEDGEEGEQDGQQSQSGDDKDGDGKADRQDTGKGGQKPQDDPNQGKEEKKKDGDLGAAPQYEDEKKDGAGGDKKEEEMKDGKDGKDAEKEGEGEEGKQKEATGQGEGAKKDGELKQAGQAGRRNDKETAEQAEQRAIMQAAKDGKMTPKQAKALLDSLRSEDRRVILVDPRERKTPDRVLRDW